MTLKFGQIFFAILVTIMCLNTFSQKDYTDPTERKKRGLLEEPLEEAPAPTPEPAPEPAPAPVEKTVTTEQTTEQKRVCQCDHLSILLKKTADRYYHEGMRMNALNYDSNDHYRMRQEGRKAVKVTNILRNRHDLEEYRCPYQEITAVKFKDLRKLVKAQRRLCDLDQLGR